MGNKVNPVGFRLGINKPWESRWYAPKGAYRQLLEQDRKIRKLIGDELAHAGLSAIEIERAAHQVSVNVIAAKPGIVIGKGGDTIKHLRERMEKMLAEGPGNGGTRPTLQINVQEAGNPNLNAALVAQRVAEQLERRFAHRRAMRQAVQRVMESGALGVKVMCAGRLGGSEQARSEHYKDGRVPLHTLRADIDYGTAEAHTTYGIIGVKVWIFHRELIGDQTARGAQPAPAADASARRRRPSGRSRRDRGPGSEA
jgi:small subunit ribosomal protein S3